MGKIDDVQVVQGKQTSNEIPHIPGMALHAAVWQETPVF